MSIQEQQAYQDGLDDETVLDYLVRHPDFLLRHPELLGDLDLPHDCGSAISLPQYQARVLRGRLKQLQLRLDELLAVARDNDRLSERMHRLTLELIDADSFDAAVFSLKDALRSDFSADAVALRVFSEHADDNQPELIRAEHPALAAFAAVLAEQKPLCGRFTREQLNFLFGDTATAIGSAALIPLVDGKVIGLLAVGSYKPDHFHSGQGTVFLRQLGAIAGRALKRQLS